MRRLPILALFLFALVGCDNSNTIYSRSINRELISEYSALTAVIDRIDDAFRRLRELGYTEKDFAGMQFFAVRDLRRIMRREPIAEKIAEAVAKDAGCLETTRDELGALERLVNRLDDGMARKTPDTQ